jgi:predicted CXXCH cytochrome family protein
MLKKPTESELCTECHKEILHGKFVHGPVFTSCTACHKAHVSSHPKLLSTDTRSLCLTCHVDVGKSITGAAHQHAPATGDCLECHRPHASDHAKQLKEEPVELCGTCHKGVLEAAKGSSHPHAAVTDEKACLNCHSPHGSENAKLMKQDIVSTCLECHKQPIVVDKTTTVVGVPELANQSFHKHGPIGKGSCSACHDVHGGTHDKLLVEPYPEGFYQPYADKTYALCFKCHDKQGIVNKEVEHQTRFRDGTRNLHALHVNKTPQGRSCRACHNVHASRSDSLLADSVSFGEWNLPVNHKKTETGGSCAPGCHKPATYDRGPETGVSPLLVAPAGAEVGPPPEPK